MNSQKKSAYEQLKDSIDTRTQENRHLKCRKFVELTVKPEVD